MILRFYDSVLNLISLHSAPPPSRKEISRHDLPSREKSLWPRLCDTHVPRLRKCNPDWAKKKIKRNLEDRLSIWNYLGIWRIDLKLIKRKFNSDHMQNIRLRREKSNTQVLNSEQLEEQQHCKRHCPMVNHKPSTYSWCDALGEKSKSDFNTHK